MTISKDSKNEWQRLPFSLTIADLEAENEPLVYVNRAFEKMTGYSSSAVVGRNCRFLQGENTDPETVKKLSRAVENRANVDVTIYNYRANGEGFWNRLVMGPLGEDDADVRYFVGFQYDLGAEQVESERKELDRQLAEVQHRVKNHLSMVVGMIRLQANRGGGGTDVFLTLSRRVEALQLLYQEMNEAGSNKATDEIIQLGAYLGRIVSALNHIDGRHGIKVNFNSDTVNVATETAARIGLILSEILTNSLQHAFDGRAHGTVEVQARLLSDHILRISMEDDGHGMPEDCDWPREGNLGAKIVRMLTKGLDATLNVVRGQAGTVISLDIPLDRQAAQIESERREVKAG